MAQKLLISFYDNDACAEKERIPFLVFYKQWGGFTASAVELVDTFQHLIRKNKKDLTKIFKKENHQDELADKMVELINGSKNVWLPWCGLELNSYGYDPGGVDDDIKTRTERIKLSKLIFLANGLHYSASLIHAKTTYWDKITGILGVTPETIKWFSDCALTDGDILEIHIGIDSDTTCWTTFGIMDLSEMELTPEEKEKLASEGVTWVESVDKYTGEMSPELFKEFSRIIQDAEKDGIIHIASEKEKLKITLI